MSVKSNVKLAIQKTIRVVGRCFYRKHVWLVADREWEAGDNGEAFFRFLQSKPVYSVFAISKHSPDYEMMKQVGKVVDFGSLKYTLLLCVADVYISSHEIHMAGHKETPHMFVSHGISYRDLHKYFNRFTHENVYTVTASKAERDRIGAPPYTINPEHVFLTGYPRYDRLPESKSEKIITLALTWRPSLWGISKEDIAKSEYFKLYTSIFECKKLLDSITERGYTLKVKLHPQMEKYKDIFSLPEGISLWDEKITYREMYEKSSLMVTDYSSAIYDFAYLKKPVVYYQPDYEDLVEAYNGEYKYDYYSKGMGDVTKTVEEFSQCISSYIDKDCVMKDIYRNRVEQFFEYNDKKNCERVYNVICKILNK
ncbi:MAG: CDP-glycerol glycerophosphotransferase family protein [Lachnospiraceae bacterium]|nr:CDP-glycerol glycerophosphotransferase family protein [Lachnospiraceae bacterium]